MNQRVAVVTGASRGLGAAFVAELAGRGFSVAGYATAPAGAEQLDLYRALDAFEAAAVDGFAEEVSNRFGRIDLWINNAALVGPVGPFRDTSHEEWERIVAVNILGVAAGTRAFLPRRSEDATLINMSSRASRGAWSGIGAYAATKAAVVSMTQALAEEERESGLRAYAVLPPSIDTDMQRLLLRQEESAYPGVVEARRRRDEGRVLPPRDAAALILSSALDRHPDDVVLDLTSS